MTTPAPEKQWFEAACHCHAVEYKVLLPDPYSFAEDGTIECNCSICTKNGYVLMYPERHELIWLKGEEILKNYEFATKTRDHRFCGNCGSSILIDFRGRGKVDVLGINARMIKGIDLERVSAVSKKFDGRSKLVPQFNEETA